jgi:transcription regulator MmyB-like protein/helix-turn-helix protein
LLAAVDPQQVGIPDDGRLRRVPGLRREELAQLAHVSVDYVVRLEQGRSRRVSRPVLDALADALRLAPDERDYLFAAADVVPGAAARQPVRGAVSPQLRQLLDTMHDVPAMVLSRTMDVLAWNGGAAALLTDFEQVALPRRNLIWLTFLDKDFRALYADWPRAARECVAVLRMEAGRKPDDTALRALIDELAAGDADFRSWWATHQVRGPHQLTKTYVHPVVGELTLEVQQFTVDTHPEQFLIAYTVAADSPSYEGLRFLLQWSVSRAPVDAGPSYDPEV